MKLTQFRKLIREEVRRVMSEAVLNKKEAESMLATLNIPKENLFQFYKDPVSQGLSYKITILKINSKEHPNPKGASLTSYDISKPIMSAFDYKRLYKHIPNRKLTDHLSIINFDITSNAFVNKLQKALEESEFNVLPGSIKITKLAINDKDDSGDPEVGKLLADQRGLSIRFITAKN